MKRFFFSIIALAAAAVSCTQSALLETPELDGTPVSFSTYTGRTPVSKAASIADAAGLADEGGFRVYSFLNQTGKDKQVYLENESVTSSDGTSWSYENTVYWPATTGSTLDFVAYSANAVNKGLVLNGTTGFTFTVQDAVSNQVDLLATAYQAGKTPTSEGVSSGDVTLEFFHLLSRVGFKVQTGSTRAFTVKSLSITGDAPVAGTLTFEDYTGEEIPALTPTQTVEDKEYFYVNTDVEMTEGAAEATAITGMDSQYMMFMPHSAAGHVISITYTIGDSETEKTATAALPADFKFLQGKAYEFILKLSTSALTFDVTEEEWNETGDTDLQPEPEEDPEEEPAEETNEFGIVVNLVSYNKTKNIARFKVTITQTQYKGTTYKGLRLFLTNKSDGTTTSATGATFVDSSTPLTIGESYYDVPGGTGTGLNGKIQPNKTVYYYPVTSTPSMNTDFRRIIKSFTTHEDYTAAPDTPTDTPSDELLDPTEYPVVTIESLIVNQTAKTAVVTGSFIEGISSVTNYGFCWMTGAGTPTISNNYYECTSSFSHTITGLSEGVYSCCAYVTTKDGETYYSPVRTIEIEPAVNEEDNTGSGSWESGDEY